MNVSPSPIQPGPTRLAKLIASYGFDIVAPQVAPAEIKAAMAADKKKKDGKIRFVLMEGPGKPVLREVPEADLDAVLGISG